MLMCALVILRSHILYIKWITQIFFRDLFESIEDYRNIVLLIFLIQNDENLSREIGFSERDINRLILAFKDILLGQHENYLNYVKNDEESLVERFVKK